MRVTMAKRLLWLGALMLLLFGLLGGRLYRLQIQEGQRYARIAHQQRTLSLPIPEQRGQVFDRHGQPLSDPQEGWGVALFPPLMREKEATVRTLATALGRPEQEVAAKLRSQGEPFWLAKDVGEKVATAVREMNLPGVVVTTVGTRYGPNAVARHLIGYVNAKGGQLGVEYAYDDALGGEAVPAMAAVLDGNGRPMQGIGLRTVLPQVGKRPYHLYTTVDRQVQIAVEQVLEKHSPAVGRSLRAAVVVLEPKTGEIRAMASRPSFDQTTGPEGLSGQGEAFLLNRALSPFEPGSVFKAVVAAAALDGGYVKPDEQFYCPGHYEVGGERFRDGQAEAHGSLTFRQAMARSCNVIFAKVGYERLGAARLLDAARRFGFGQVSGTGLREESPGHLPNLEYGGEVAQFAFGQGLLSTPLQVARAFAAIANGGTLPPIRLVNVVKDPSGKVIQRPDAPPGVRVISRQTAWQLQKALAAVTDPMGLGTGRKAWVEAGGSAGKTGSAEGTEDGKQTTHAWFAGYLPLEAPRYVIAVLVQGGGSGGEVAAPIFREIGSILLEQEGTGRGEGE